MALKHLSQILATAGIDLTQKQLLNARIQNLPAAPNSPVAGQIYYDTADTTMYFWNGSAWVDMKGDIQAVNAGLGLTGGGTTGSIDIAVNATIAGNGLTWDSDNGIIDVGASDGIEVTGSNVRFKNATNLTDNKLMLWDDVNAQLANSTISQSSQVTQEGTEYTITIGADSTIISGNLIVQGTTTTVNSNTVEIGDSVILLNSDETGTPSQNAGFEVERGNADNVSFVWDETNDRFTTVDQELHVGDIPSYTVPTSISSQALGTAVLVNDNTTTNSESGVIRKMSAAQFWRFAGAPIVYTLDVRQGGVTKTGNTYTVTHDLQTKAVMAQVIEYTSGATVFVDVTRVSNTQITIAFEYAVTDNDYYVILTGARRSGDTVAPSPEGDEPEYAG